MSSAGGDILARAGRDLVIEAGEAGRQLDQASYKKKSGTFSSKTTVTRDTVDSTSAIASTFSGENVTLAADRDLTVRGSNVAATQDATLVAGENLTIAAATETHSETHFKQTRQSGLFGSGGFGVTLGSRQNSTDQQMDATAAAGSTVGSVEGNVSLIAGEKYRQVGSDVIAVQGDIDIAAKTVEIVEARESSRTVVEQKSRQSGLTLAITSPIITALQTAQQMSQAAKDTKDGRMKALAAASAGLATYDAAQKVAEAGSVAGGANLVLSLGGSKSSSKTTQTSDSAAGSTLAAGRDLVITASGGGAESSITLQGAQASAARNLVLSAEDEIRLLAATNTADQKSKNQNASGSIGISIGTNTGFTVGASVGRGKADGDDLSHTNTRVEAGQTLVLESGGDTTLKGAVAKGERVVAKVGGDLLVESLQDTSTYDSKQKSLGGSITIGVGVSGAISASSSKVKSDYASVVEQSAIRAGDGGFQVDVQGDTTLTGGAITSTQKAVDENLNRFETDGKLTLSDIQNKAEYEGKSVGVSIGAGKDNNGKYVPQGSSAGIGKDSGSASSTTLAAISGIAGNIDARTGDKETGIKPIFDAAKVQREINAQVAITQQFGQQASKAVEDYVQEQKQILSDAYKNASEADRPAIQARYDDLLLQERVVNVLIGTVTGLAGSALAKETLATAADELHRIAVEDSMKSPGIVDAYGNIVTNLRPGEEHKLRQDRDLAGTRLDFDGICGNANERCVRQRDENNNLILDANGKPQLAYDANGRVQFSYEPNGKQVSINEFLDSDEGKKMAGTTGGIQGATATFAGFTYEPGGVIDRVFKAFGGPHDVIGGQLPGFYDDKGNRRPGMTKAESNANEIWTVVALVPATPFALATLFPPEVWKGISILLGAAK